MFAINGLSSGFLLLIALTGCTPTRIVDPSLGTGKALSELREKASPWVFPVSWITPKSDSKSDNEVERLNDLRLKLVGKVLSVGVQGGQKIYGTSLADTLFYEDKESTSIKEWGLAFAPFGAKERSVQCDQVFDLPDSGRESGKLPGYPLDFYGMKAFFPNVLVMRSDIADRDYCQPKYPGHWSPGEVHWSHHFRVFSDKSFEVKDKEGFNVVKNYEKTGFYADIVLTAKNEWKILGHEKSNKDKKPEIELLDCANATVNLCPRRLKSKIPISSLAPVSTDKLTASLYTYRSVNTTDDPLWGDQLIIDAQVNPAGEAEVSLFNDEPPAMESDLPRASRFFNTR